MILLLCLVLVVVLPVAGLEVYWRWEAAQTAKRVLKYRRCFWPWRDRVNTHN